MKKLMKTVKYIFYRLVSKKMLITIIFGLLCFILFNNTTVFGYTSVRSPSDDALNFLYSTPEYEAGDNFVITRYGTYTYNYLVYFFPQSTNLNVKAFIDGSNLNITTSNGSYDGVYYRQDRYGWSSQPQSFSGSGVLSVSIYNEASIRYFSSFNLYTDNTYSTVFYYGTPQPSPYIEPYFSETDEELSYLNIPSVNLFGGTVPDTTTFVFSVSEVTGSDSGNTVFQITLNKNSVLFKENNGNYYYEIPVTFFKDKLEAGKNYRYYVYWSDGVEDYNIMRLTLYLGLSSSQQINNQNNEIIEQQQAINNSISETNNFLKDDNFNDSDLMLPDEQVTDITEDGINNIFTQIYTGFTSGEATDIVIPIPFTGKSFTINSNLTSNVLNSNGFGWLKTIIEAFWWYIISTFIVKDISKKINKIKSGDFENLETNNIKEDML